MNIPSLQNLIERAIPPQTALRQYVLAAAAVTVMCGAASAQSAPAAPPLSLRPAVEVSHPAQEGEVLTLEQSSDLTQWESPAAPIFGNGAPVTLLEPVPAGSDCGYYRLRLDTRPSIGLAPWALAGHSLRLSEGASNRLFTLQADGAGTMTSSGGPQSFTWAWQRSGMDAGVLTLTWPDGTHTLQELDYLSAASGVFVTREPSPVAALSTGTFHIDPVETAAAEAPAALENVRIDISGSGRPCGLVIGLANALLRVTPLGTESCEITYLRTGETTALLLLSIPPMQQEISLTFTGPDCGSCLTRETRAGVLRRESEGTFIITGQP